MRAFIDEAINQGAQIKQLKKDSVTQEVHQKKTFVIDDTNEWILDDDDATNEEQHPINVEPVNIFLKKNSL